MTKLTDMNHRMIKAMEEACWMVLELAILEDESVDVRVQKLGMAVHDTRQKSSISAQLL